MPHEPDGRVLNVLGLIAFGDFADLTTYVSQRGQVVWFKKTWPDKPPSARQIYDRERFALATAEWNALPNATKAEWNKAARKASLCATGFNLYMYCWLAPHRDCLRTIARQTRCTLDCACYQQYYEP